MKAGDCRITLESIGCWPPKCHACDKQLTADSLIEWAAVKDASGTPFMALVHLGCVGKPVKPPTSEVLDAQKRASRSGERSGGAYLSEAAMDALNEVLGGQR